MISGQSSQATTRREPTCDFCKGVLPHYSRCHYLCHICGATYSYIHMRRHQGAHVESGSLRLRELRGSRNALNLGDGRTTEGQWKFVQTARRRLRRLIFSSPWDGQAGSSTASVSDGPPSTFAAPFQHPTRDACWMTQTFS
jgi:hypothetical protein